MSKPKYVTTIYGTLVQATLDELLGDIDTPPDWSRFLEVRVAPRDLVEVRAALTDAIYKAYARGLNDSFIQGVAREADTHAALLAEAGNPDEFKEAVLRVVSDAERESKSFAGSEYGR